jgi:hypothetical protein
MAVPDVRGSRSTVSFKRSLCSLRVWVALVLLVVQGVFGWTQVRSVIDLAYPVPGVAVITPEEGLWPGYRVVFLGDIDGDGYDDLGLNQSRAYPDLTHTWVFYGSEHGIGPGPMESLRHTKLIHGDSRLGEISSFFAGCQLAAAGDVDADGYDDFLFGSPMSHWNGVNETGLALLIFGGTGWPGEVSLVGPLPQGVRVKYLVSREPELQAGAAVANAGDMNGDGLDELIVISMRASGAVDGHVGGGRVFVVYGSRSLADEVWLQDLGASTRGFVFLGDMGGTAPEDGDGLGRSIAAVGDVNGDGFGDLLVGAPTATRGGVHERGCAYLVYGGRDIAPRFSTSTLGAGGVEFRLS